MIEAITVATVNARAQFDQPEIGDHLEEVLDTIKPDVLLVTESASNGPSERLEQFAAGGDYRTQTVAYQDTVRHPSGEQYMTLAARNDLNPEFIEQQLGPRAALELRMARPAGSAMLRLVGAHLDDRSRFTRIDMIHALDSLGQTDEVGTALPPPDLLVMRGNMMHPQDRIARFLRASQLHRVLPDVDAQAEYDEQSQREGESALSRMVRRAVSLTTRLVDRADGEEMLELERRGYRDIDDKHEPTMRTGPLAVQADNILLYGALGHRTESVAVTPIHGLPNAVLSARIALEPYTEDESDPSLED